MFRASRRAEGAHRDSIWCVKWTKISNNIITGSLDGTIKNWNQDLASVATSNEQKLGMISAVPLNDESCVISCCQDSIIRFHNFSDLQETTFLDPGMLESWKISISPDDSLFASGTQNGTVHIWSVKNRSYISLLQAHKKFILSNVFSPDGTKIATSSINGVVTVFDIESKRIIFKIDAHSMPCRSVAFSKDGDLLFTSSDDRHVNVYDLLSGTLVNSFSHSGMALCVDVSPNDRHFVVGCSDHSVALWDMGMQRQFQTFNDQHSENVWGVSFDSTGDKFVSVGDDALIQTYEKSSKR